MIEDCRDLNIFSGKNDSGKSNILRALNLFFSEDKIDFYQYLDFVNDFSRQRERIVTSDQIKGKKIFTIRVFFNRVNYKSTILPEQFWVEKTWDKEGNVSRKTRGKDGKVYKNKPKVEASTTLFLGKIRYLYVPAVKDASFFNHLKKSYLESLSEKTSVITDGLAEKVNQEAQTLMKAFSVFTPEVSSPEFAIPNFEMDFSKFLEITTEGKDKNIYLNRRGDGIQAKFIPQILDGITANSKSEIVIWGFEEPENSLEYGNAQQLAKSFSEVHSQQKQIFITSHSFTFTSLYANAIAQYRVYKEDFESGTKVVKLDDIRQGRLFVSDDDAIKLEEELGIISLNNDLERLYKRRASELKDIASLKESIKREQKPVLVVEDKHDGIYKAAWLKVREISFTQQDMEDVFSRTAPFVIHPAGGAGAVAGLLRQENVSSDLWGGKKVCGLFDFDKEGVENFCNIKKAKNWEEEIKGDKKSGYYKKRNQHPCFYALLLPVPDRLGILADLSHPNFSNYVEVENLLDEGFLREHDFVEEKGIVGTIYFKIKDSKKDNLWKDLVDAEPSVFADFKPLFDKVDVLFAS